MKNLKQELFITWHRSKTVLLLFSAMAAFSFYFTQRYTIAFNGAESDCLNARVFLIDKWDREFTNGHIIAFSMQVDNGIHPIGTVWVKKVAAMPGQTVHVTHESVSVENKTYRLSATYIFNKLNKDPDELKSSWDLSSTEVFMIGETLTSYDSRFWGPIDTNHVVGRAYAII